MGHPNDVANLGISAVFDEHRVAYVIAGGTAAALLGADLEPDIFDAVVDMRRANLALAAEALRTLGARVRVEGADDGVIASASPTVSTDWLELVEVSTWQTQLGAVNLSAYVDTIGGRLDYDTLHRRCCTVEIGGRPVRVAHIEDLIAAIGTATHRDRRLVAELEQLTQAVEPGLDIGP